MQGGHFLLKKILVPLQCTSMSSSQLSLFLPPYLCPGTCTVPCKIILEKPLVATNFNSLDSASSSFVFSRQGSPQRIFHLNSILTSGSSSVTSTTAVSSLTPSVNLLLGLPRFPFPGSSILVILIPICPSYFLRTFPNHLNSASRVFCPQPQTTIQYDPFCKTLILHTYLLQ